MWEPQDAEPLAEIYRQPEYLETMPPANAATQIAMWRGRWEEEDFSQRVACDRVSGLLVGCIGLIRHHDWPLVPDPAEVEPAIASRHGAPRADVR